MEACVISYKSNNKVNEILITIQLIFEITVSKKYISYVYSEQHVIVHACIGTGRKAMFYLTTHSTHFIYGYNGVRHVKDGGNPLPPHRLLFSISCKGIFICFIPQTG